MWPKFLRLYEVHDIAGINRLSKSLVTRMLIGGRIIRLTVPLGSSKLWLCLSLSILKPRNPRLPSGSTFARAYVVLDVDDL